MTNSAVAARTPSRSHAPSIAGNEASDDCVDSAKTCTGSMVRAKRASGWRATSAAKGYAASHTTVPDAVTTTM